MKITVQAGPLLCTFKRFLCIKKHPVQLWQQIANDRQVILSRLQLAPLIGNKLLSGRENGRKNKKIR